MRRLWRPPPGDVPWRRLENDAERWLVSSRALGAARAAVRAPAPRRGARRAAELGPTQEDVVLCHQDLHGGNILRAEREPWLVIDAKPIVAERAYDTVALSATSTHGASAAVRRRLDLLSELLGLDRERMRGWGIAKSLGAGGETTTRREARLLSEVRSR